MARIWDDHQKAAQSLRTLERKPSNYSSGPKSEKGKAKVRRNSMKCGYFTEVHRNARKIRRSPEARHIESLIRTAGKTKDSDEFLNLVDQIMRKLDDYGTALSSQNIIEATYLNSLVLLTINKSLFNRITKMISEYPEYIEKLKTA
jgi:hypothetical protein